MTPVERYQHLTTFWKKQLEEARQTLAEASKNYDHWSNKLVEAEIAERLEAGE